MAYEQRGGRDLGGQDGREEPAFRGRGKREFEHRSEDGMSRH